MKMPKGARRAIVFGFSCWFAAIIFAAFGQWLGWHVAPDLPNRVAADEMAAQIVRSNPSSVSRMDDLFQYETMSPMVSLLGADGYMPGFVRFTFPVDDRQSLEVVADRMRATGWEVTKLKRPSGTEVRGVRGSTYAVFRVSQNDSTLILKRATPIAAMVLSVTGALLGGTAGWFIARLVVRRWGQARRRLAATVTGGLAALFLLPGMLLTTIAWVATALTRPREPYALWGIFMFVGVKPLTLLGLVLIVVAAVLISGTKSPSSMK
ncbi:MAG TPA: hypothetical protein VF174_08170 [Micromonosporaceae bacterium]